MTAIMRCRIGVPLEIFLVSFLLFLLLTAYCTNLSLLLSKLVCILLILNLYLLSLIFELLLTLELVTNTVLFRRTVFWSIYYCWRAYICYLVTYTRWRLIAYGSRRPCTDSSWRRCCRHIYIYKYNILF